nr:exonuclease domain-containing protein [Acidobacteriota bacterium]
LAVRGQPTLGELAPEVLRHFEGADLGGYNSIKFDLPLLAADLARVGFRLETGGRRHVDAMRIFHEMERRDLAAALRFYCGRELERAHSALADASATLAILDAQLARYPELPRDLAGLHRFCHPDEGRFADATRKLEWAADGELALGFGKHRGRTLRELAARERSYLEWVTGSDFSPEVKEIVGEALRGIFPRRPGAE